MGVPSDRCRLYTRIGHVVDFAYYVDGGRTIPTRAQLGELFCDDPSFRPTPSAPRTKMDELHEEQGTEEMNVLTIFCHH
ncbi:hypothetical protein F441_08099 [Phytophthora nicotianae CJ01A1]|uniref:Uncharacterized protein n=1 Tax=Phytophthora nicotianae CJ01A1 TaxID=1317063 RepID=W2X565_PHYNI|nr:hypothetical protein F441_08099 [Phytophthora nicotianae CJ01A1]